jgi:hypothetical protein
LTAAQILIITLFMKSANILRDQEIGFPMLTVSEKTVTIFLPQGWAKWRLNKIINFFRDVAFEIEGLGITEKVRAFFSKGKLL